MSRRNKVMVTLIAICGAMSAVAAAPPEDRNSPSTGLVREVRLGTQDFRNPMTALGAGYGSTGSCVTGPQEGAMGIHYANGALIGDGLLDPQRPELLIYEQRGGRLRLVGVEFLVLAPQWDAAHPGAPPVPYGPALSLCWDAQPLRPPSILRIARLGVERQSKRHVRRLESSGIVRGIRRRGRFGVIRRRSRGALIVVDSR